MFDSQRVKSEVPSYARGFTNWLAHLWYLKIWSIPILSFFTCFCVTDANEYRQWPWPSTDWPLSPSPRLSRSRTWTSPRSQGDPGRSRSHDHKHTTQLWHNGQRFLFELCRCWFTSNYRGHYGVSGSTNDFYTFIHLSSKWSSKLFSLSLFVCVAICPIF